MAFVDPFDVPKAFVEIENQACEHFAPILSYFKTYYIGELKPNSKTARTTPPFPINRWNVHQRVLDSHCRSDAAPEA